MQPDNAFSSISWKSRMSRHTSQQNVTTIMWTFRCDLQPQIPKHPIPTYAQTHLKQLEATVTVRQKKKANRPQPHPPHARGTFHRRPQPLYMEKHTVSCSGFLPSTSPMQRSCSHHNAFCSTTWLTRIYLRTWQQSMTTIMPPFLQSLTVSHHTSLSV